MLGLLYPLPPITKSIESMVTQSLCPQFWITGRCCENSWDFCEAVRGVLFFSKGLSPTYVVVPDSSAGNEAFARTLKSSPAQRQP
jgi:hypothetical protein